MLAQAAILLAVVTAGCIISRLYLHPLAKYPGPLLGRLTDWYNVYHSMKGDRHIDFIRLHEKYGPFVRYGPNRLSINSAAAIRTIYGTQPQMRKSDYYDSMRFYMKYTSTNATTDIAEHARKRKALAPALSDRMLHVYEQGYLRILEAFISQFATGENETGAAVHDLGQAFTLLTFDAMGDFCFGKSFRSMGDPNKAEILEISSDGIRGLNAVGHMHGLAHLGIDKLNSRLFNAMEEYKSYSSALAQQCIVRSKTHTDAEAKCVLDVMLARTKLDKMYSIPELESESSLLVTAGAETTASALASTIFHLLNNPTTMANLIQEIRTTFSDAEAIRTGPTLNSCTYLSAVIDESLRLSPPVGGCLQRIVPPGGTMIEGEHIPGGVDVGVPENVVMRNPDYFQNPLSFMPERWLENSPEELRKMRLAFCPFSVGPTGCIGKTWAIVELKLTIAHLLFRYDLEMVVPEGEKSLSPVERMLLRERRSLDKFVVCGTKGLHVRFREAVKKF